MSLEPKQIACRDIQTTGDLYSLRIREYGDARTLVVSGMSNGRISFASLEEAQRIALAILDLTHT